MLIAGLMSGADVPAAADRGDHIDARGDGVVRPLGRTLEGWQWPLTQFVIAQPYVAPAHRYGPGHRGIDLRPKILEDVAAPADGIVAFVGMVAGRGIVTIDHGGGLVTTLEPVIGTVPAGSAVAAGDVVGALGGGGHSAAGLLHFGVRKDGEYINPMILLARVPRAILLPCC